MVATDPIIDALHAQVACYERLAKLDDLPLDAAHRGGHGMRFMRGADDDEPPPAFAQHLRTRLGIDPHAPFAHARRVNGDGQIGIHGTNQPHLLPGRPSHGCVRVNRYDAPLLYEFASQGTPVDVVYEGV